MLISGYLPGKYMYDCYHPYYMPECVCNVREKILKNIEKTEKDCWLYKKSTSGEYSKLRWEGKWHSAHRISYEAFVGPIPKSKWVCHKCDIPKCVNPVHLFIGSASDNRKDAVKKKRIPMGEQNHFTKFTDVQVEEMRLLKKEGCTYERLARIFNCSFTYVKYIMSNKIRKEDKHVESEHTATY